MCDDRDDDEYSIPNALNERINDWIVSDRTNMYIHIYICIILFMALSLPNPVRATKSIRNPVIVAGECRSEAVHLRTCTCFANVTRNETETPFSPGTGAGWKNDWTYRFNRSHFNNGTSGSCDPRHTRCTDGTPYSPRPHRYVHTCIRRTFNAIRYSNPRGVRIDRFPTVLIRDRVLFILKPNLRGGQHTHYPSRCVMCNSSSRRVQCNTRARRPYDAIFQTFNDIVNQSERGGRSHSRCLTSCRGTCTSM